MLLLMLQLASPLATAALASSKPGRGDATGNATAAAARLRPGKKELLQYKRIRSLLRKLNKPSLKTIKVSAE